MIEYCYDTLNPQSIDFTRAAEIYHELMLGDLAELMRKEEGLKTYKKRVNDIKVSKSVLEKIIKQEEISEEEAKTLSDFFSDLSKRCKEILDGKQ